MTCTETQADWLHGLPITGKPVLSLELSELDSGGLSKNAEKHFSPSHLSGVSGGAHVLTAAAPPLSFITRARNVLPRVVLLAYFIFYKVILNTAKN